MHTLNHYTFFYGDEKVSCTLVYQTHRERSILSPSQIIGTNYGRIFIISLFQQRDGVVHPVIVIDNHFGEKIEGLFIANHRYLISVSHDGTLCVTDLMEKSIERKFNSVHRRKKRVHPRVKRRFDKKIRAFEKDRVTKRRASIHNDHIIQWNLVRHQVNQRMECLTPFGICKILEIKDIEVLRSWA